MSSSPTLVRIPATRGLSPLAVLGSHLVVPLATGGDTRYVNLDYAASAPPLRAVRDALDEIEPWYSSVHRGAGFTSQVCTELLGRARRTLGSFVGARTDDVVVFTRNTTDALNLLAHALPDDTTVITFVTEHHANLLPWRRGTCVVLPPPTSPEGAVRAIAAALREVRTRNALVAVTGASNVTGEVWPIAEIATVVQRHGARLVVDAAQLAPHRHIDIEALGVDYVALSGHKLYAPYGTGALIGRTDWLDDAPPYLFGGGATRHVTADDVDWCSGPARHEAGTPNVLGAAAVAVACRELKAVGFDEVEAHERRLLERLRDGVASLDRVVTYSLWDDSSERIGVLAFNVRGLHHAHVAAILSAEHGIGVRDGAFCAHPLVGALVARRATGHHGAVRASFGLGTTTHDIDRLVSALADVSVSAGELDYREINGRYVPADDLRSLPRLLDRI